MADPIRASLIRVAPYFPVADVAALGSWYERVLGFACEYTAGDPPVFAIYGRSGCPVMLRRVEDASLIRPSETQGGTWDAFFWVDDVDALHAELAGNGARILQEPVLQPYGVREMAVRDPSGHVLGFGQTIESADAPPG